jgi:hypothetical protein
MVSIQPEDDKMRLFCAIDMFFNCLYSSSNNRQLMVEYYTFVGNANCIANPSFNQDVEQVIYE